MKRPPRIPVEGLRGGEWELPPEAGHHVARVLRRARGDRLLLFDPKTAAEALGKVVSVDGACVVVWSEEPRLAAAPEREVVLVQALGKGDKMDAIVRDATELGATRIVPAVSERSVVKPGERAAAKVERWRRIADEAARQCERARAPQIDDIAPLVQAASAVEADTRLLLVPGAGRAAGPELVGARGSVALAVGPEGGLGAAEVEALAAAGWVVASLGPRVLRTETVAAAVLGALVVLDSGRWC